MFPQGYKAVLSALALGPRRSIAELVAMFSLIREEIEACQEGAEPGSGSCPDLAGLDYKEARRIVSETVAHEGYIEIDDDVHDSVDDCADLLIELDLLQRMESVCSEGEVWWHYRFYYESHFGQHMRNLEAQAEWLSSRGPR